MASDNTIIHWECPKCGRVGAKGHPHTPKWTPAYERNPHACDGVPVERIFVAVDALLGDEAQIEARNAVVAHTGQKMGATAAARDVVQAAVDAASSRNEVSS